MDDQHVSSNQDIRQEQSIKTIMERMPDEVANSFTDLQLIHLKTAIGSRQWGKHPIDCRGTLTFPFFRWHLYYVLLLGRNRRRLSQRERAISSFFSAFLLSMFLLFCMLLGLLVLYLIKSAAGIDIFPNFSFGIWDYFKDWIQ